MKNIHNLLNVALWSNQMQNHNSVFGGWTHDTNARTTIVWPVFLSARSMTLTISFFCVRVNKLIICGVFFFFSVSLCFALNHTRKVQVRNCRFLYASFNLFCAVWTQTKIQRTFQKPNSIAQYHSIWQKYAEIEHEENGLMNLTLGRTSWTE